MPLRTVITGLFILALDLASKWLVQSSLALHQSVPVIPGFFHLTYLMNPGAAFGLLAGQRTLFLVVTVAAIGLILYYSTLPQGRAGLAPWALGLLLGGAAGNLVDRIRYGEVVDFLLFFWRDYYFPAFNVADSAINVGVGLLILHLFRDGQREEAAHE